MLVDFHAHTSGISKCCAVSAQEVIATTKAFGMDGIVLTNHYKKDYITGNIKDFVEAYIEEYHYTKSLAESIDIKVFFGIELTMEKYHGLEMLIYGVDVDFLRKHLNIFDYSLKELYTAVKESKGVLVQPHPFRNGSSLLDTNYLDGVEINCHPKYKKSYYKELLDIAHENNLIVTCGGDFHNDTYRPKCGMYLPDNISDEKMLVNYLIEKYEYNLCIQEPYEECCDIVFSKQS